eukprot:gene991-9897_t
MKEKKKKSKKSNNFNPISIPSTSQQNEDKEVEDCTICMEKINELATINGCEHQFCFDCIKQWSTKSNTCPLCRKRFTKIESEKKKKTVKKRDQRSDLDVPLEVLQRNQMRFHQEPGENLFRRLLMDLARNFREEPEEDTDDDSMFIPNFFSTPRNLPNFQQPRHNVVHPPNSVGSSQENPISLVDEPIRRIHVQNNEPVVIDEDENDTHFASDGETIIID